MRIEIIWCGYDKLILKWPHFQWVLSLSCQNSRPAFSLPAPHTPLFHSPTTTVKGIKYYNCVIASAIIISIQIFVQWNWWIWLRNRNLTHEWTPTTKTERRKRERWKNTEITHSRFVSSFILFMTFVIMIQMTFSSWKYTQTHVQTLYSEETNILNFRQYGVKWRFTIKLFRSVAKWQITSINLVNTHFAIDNRNLHDFL